MRFRGNPPWSEAPQPNPGDVCARTFSRAEDEVSAVVFAIERWRSAGTQLGEIAILTRRRNDRADAIVASLEGRGIAVLNEYVRQDQLNQPLGRAMLCFWHTLTHPNEQRPKAWTELRDALWSAQAAWGDEQAERRLTQQLGALIRHARAGAGVDLSDAEAMVGAAKDLLVKLFKIEEVASRWSPSETDDWSKDAEVVADAYKEQYAKTGDAALAVEHLFGIGAVRLMTIHKCKGMEFERVIVLGVESVYYYDDAHGTACELFVACSRAKRSLRLTRQQNNHTSGASRGLNWFDERLEAAGLPFRLYQPPPAP
jgi:superfamily I DNA/RNA helicase